MGNMSGHGPVLGDCFYTGWMFVEVRAIAADEFERWVATTHVAFHVRRPAAEEAAYRLQALRQDLRRTLAAFDGDTLAGTLYSFPAELSLPGGTSLQADAVSAVSVLPTHRRRGLLTRLLGADLAAARERGEVASILLPAEYPIYGRFGFGAAVERADYAIETAAAEFTRAAPGAVELVERSRLRELAPSIFDRFRRSRPGQIDRDEPNWDLRLGPDEAPWADRQRATRYVVYCAPGGQLEGYAIYRAEPRSERHVPKVVLDIAELVALSAEAYLGLWRYCCEVDLVAQVTANMRSVDEVLPLLLVNPRAALQQTARTDMLWLRPLDVAHTLGARRYLCEGRLVLEVDDPLGICAGRFALEGGPHGATCRPSDATADLRMGMLALGAISLGGASLHTLADAGLIDEHTPGALMQAERLFRWPIAPWCSTFF
jgi:predicted acetyltransferase